MRFVMSFIAFFFAYLVVIGVVQPCVAAELMIEPCYAKKMMKQYAVPPETEIIDLFGHVFQMKDSCVPLRAKVTWQEHFQNMSDNFYEFKYQQSYLGELWYKTDKKILALHGSAQVFKGEDVLRLIRGFGRSCQNSRDKTCRKWIDYSFHDLSAKKLMGANSGTIQFHTPHVSEDPFYVTAARLVFGKGTNEWNIGPLILNNEILASMDYDRIIQAMQKKEKFRTRVVYNGDNDRDEEQSHKHGDIEIELDFFPACDMKLNVVSPEFNHKYLFNSETGSVQIQARVNDDFPEKYAKDLVWSVPEKTGSPVRFIPEDRKGRQITIIYEGLPEFNKDLGNTVITVEGDAGTICGNLTARQNVQLFFERDRPSSFNPDQPNWFYYWMQTAAGRGQKVGKDVFYRGNTDGCVVEKKCYGYYDQKMDDDGRFHGDSYVNICNLLTNLNKDLVYSFVLDSSKSASGIDAFAIVLLHELSHRKHWIEWWNARGGRPLTGKYINESGQVISYVDKDEDYIPDELEAALGYDKTKYSTFPPWIDTMFDEHHLTYKMSEEGWPTGSADHEDWAYPGKQWPKGHELFAVVFTGAVHFDHG